MVKKVNVVNTIKYYCFIFKKFSATFYTDINQKKLSQKVSGKLGECIFSHENSKSFWGPKAPTPL